MNQRPALRRLLLLALCCGLLTQATAAAQRSHVLVDVGDLYAEEGDYESALATWTEAYVGLLPRFRKLPFLYPVEPRILGREELGQRVLEMFAEEYPAHEVESDARALSQLGFIPGDLDLGALLRSMLTEEIAGFYDPDQKQLFLIAESSAEDNEDKGFLASWFGPADGFDPAEQKSVLAHELLHALADQHFDLLSLTRSREGDDDASLALSALIEGEAMLAITFDPARKDFGRSGLSAPDLLVRLARVALKVLAPAVSSEVFNDAPLFLRESMMFPYMAGWSFCLSLTRESGRWHAIDAAYADPPLSSEQILHPEKYPRDSPDYDPPQVILFEDPPALDPARWEIVEDNVVGEFGIEILLRPALGPRSQGLAAGWDGDRYLLYSRVEGDPHTTLLWGSTWDTPQDALEFANALLEWRGFDLGADPELAFVPGAGANQEQAQLRRPAGSEGRSAVAWASTEVWWVDDAASPEECNALLDAGLHKSRLAPKRFTQVRAEPKVAFPR